MYLREIDIEIKTMSNILPFFMPNIGIDKSSDDYYVLTGKDDLGKFAVLNAIIEEIADLSLDSDKAPNF